MTLFDVDRLFKFWSRHPPQGEFIVAIAKVLGIEFSSPTDRANYMTADAFKAFVDATDQGRALGVQRR